MRRLVGALLLTGPLLGGCATPPPPVPAPAPPPRADLYILLPDSTGKVGALSVTHAGEQQVLDSAYAAARIQEAGRLDTGVAMEQEVREIFGPALAAQPPRPVSFILYFVEGKDELTPESRRLLDQVFAEIARRPAPEIVVVGHTDRVGSVEYNDALSLSRAQRVRAELGRLGIPADRIEVAGRGKREPLVPTGDQVPEPRNRRVEITIR